MLFSRYIIFIVFLVSACATSYKIKDADTAIRLKKFSIAINLLLSDYEETNTKTERAEIANKVANCYFNIAQYTNSLKWYKKAYDLSHTNTNLLSFANALKRNEDYKEAQEAFIELSNEAVGSALYRKEASICKLAMEWKKKVYPDFYYKTFALPFNEPSNEYAPFYDASGILYLTSDRIGSVGRKKYQWSGQFFSDIYKVNEHLELVPIELGINTENNEGGGSISSDNKTLYFSRCSDLNVGDYFCQIYAKSLINIKEPEVLLELGGERFNNVHPAVHNSDTILIFSSDRINGFGNYDLYSTIFKNGSWSEPTNLGKTINTEGNEKFPTWNKDTLYFSSDFYPGMGGLDVFKTWIDHKGNWSPIQHLDYPINSGSDDFNYVVDEHFIPIDSLIHRAVFSSNRNSNTGDDIFEIYRILKTNNQNKPVSQKYLIKINYFKAGEYGLGNLNQSLDSVSVVLSNNKEIYSTGQASSLSFQTLPLDTLVIQSGRSGYLNNTYKTALPFLIEARHDTTITLEINITLYPFQFDKEFLLTDVFYDYDKYSLREEAINSLEKLITLLQANPKIKVQISSHTDCRGDEKYNMELSKNRAESVVKYLLEKGISEERLSFTGYGELYPVALCKCESCDEIQHQLNRRSTFKLIK